MTEDVIGLTEEAAEIMKSQRRRPVGLSALARISFYFMVNSSYASPSHAVIAKKIRELIPPICSLRIDLESEATNESDETFRRRPSVTPRAMFIARDPTEGSGGHSKP